LPENTPLVLNKAWFALIFQADAELGRIGLFVVFFQKLIYRDAEFDSSIKTIYVGFL
jgi:hypothetical protein